MRAVILAGGYGTRLGSLTKHTPKPLIKVGQKSVLEHIVDRLRDAGIREIIIKTHYLPQKIVEKIGDRALFYYEPVLFTWKETLDHLRPWLDGDNFFLINGDTINDLKYENMITDHKDGTILALMDDWRCAGTWIYPKNYFTSDVHLLVEPYRPQYHWFDIGTSERLEAARKYFEQGERVLCP